MKIRCDVVVKQRNGKPFMEDQKVETLPDGQKVASGGHELTIGEAVAKLLDVKKFSQIPNPRKASALAEGFYNHTVKEIDDGDLSALLEIFKESDFYFPIVNAQILSVLQEAKDGKEKVK